MSRMLNEISYPSKILAPRAITFFKNQTENSKLLNHRVGTL